MDKNKLIVGQKYLRRRKIEHEGCFMEAESYVECIQITPAGAVFFSGGNLLKLTNAEIEREIKS